MLVSDDLHSGDAVLCMPRDLFKEGGIPGSPVFVGVSDEPQEEEASNVSPTTSSVQSYKLLLPDVSSLHHQYNNLAHRIPTSAPNRTHLALQESEHIDLSGRGCNDTSSPLSLDTAISLCAPSRRWSFQAVASLRSNPSSLASDVIAAIDFNETGSLFATGGIARKIRVCNYAAILSDHPQSEASRECAPCANDDMDDFAEERQSWRPHGKGRLCRNSRPCKRKTEYKTIQSHDESALRILNTPAKLSSLKWRPLGSNVIGCGDYDGVVTEWDVEQGMCICERYEHCGQRIWSVDYSSWFPTLCASASGDGTVRLWTLNCEKSVGIIRSPGRNSICCAVFSSDGPLRVAVACADSNVYVYDVRRLESSLLCLKGHDRAASYVRFLGGEELVSASIDSSIKLWNISSSNALGFHQGGQTQREGETALLRPLRTESGVKWRQSAKIADKDEAHRLLRTFNAHVNVKNFVGLSVWKESGLVACGSESNEVFVYNKENDEPIWQMKFQTGRLHSQWQRQRMGKEMEGKGGMQDTKCFVAAVCWQQQRDHLALLAANSEGIELIPASDSNGDGASNNESGIEIVVT